MSDPFAATLATYATPEAARAYADRESRQGPGRDSSCRDLVGGIALAGLRVIDVGCGTGRDVAWFRSLGAEAVGTDASGPMLARALRDHGHPGWWREAEMPGQRETPWGGPGSVDLVWSMASLVHVPRHETPGLLARWASWLRPGGRIAIASKLGEGERLGSELGAGLPRVMVYRLSGFRLSGFQCGNDCRS